MFFFFCVSPTTTTVIFVRIDVIASLYCSRNTIAAMPPIQIVTVTFRRQIYCSDFQNDLFQIVVFNVAVMIFLTLAFSFAFQIASIVVFSHTLIELEVPAWNPVKGSPR